MIKYLFYVLVFIIFGCTNNNNFKKKGEQAEVNAFFENFIRIKKRDYDLKKIKYIRYADSLEFKYWIRESDVDTTYLKKYFNSKRFITYERPIVFANYKGFDFEDFYKYKRKNESSSFNEYISVDTNKCELMSINFLVFNEKKTRVLIYYSMDCHIGYVEVYSKKDNEWFLLKQISEIR